jgi:hypothetical protein
VTASLWILDEIGIQRFAVIAPMGPFALPIPLLEGAQSN